MQIPAQIDYSYFAPCGVNCFFCSAHLRTKKPCQGCMTNNENKTARSKNCHRKNCAKNKNLDLCVECDEFPCKSIKRLDKSYRERYDISLIENSKTIKDKGPDYFFEQEINRWCCPICNGAVDMHYKTCSECGNKITLN